MLQKHLLLQAHTIQKFEVCKIFSNFYIYQGYMYLLKNTIQNSNILLYFKMSFIPMMQSWFFQYH